MRGEGQGRLIAGYGEVLQEDEVPAAGLRVLVVQLHRVQPHWGRRNRVQVRSDAEVHAVRIDEQTFELVVGVGNVQRQAQVLRLCRHIELKGLDGASSGASIAAGQGTGKVAAL